MTKVSIIIPIFNTKDYLPKCLDSLIKQTLNEIEIICVNDGSTDGSDIVIEEYAKKDSRIKTITQKNLKQGAARNNGVKIAQGEYIGYVDSDDWVDLDYFEKLYNAAKKHDLDIAIATNIRIGNGKTKKRLDIKEEIVVTELQAKIDITKQFKNECPTNKIYKKDFLKENNIIWEEGVFCEDKIYTMQALFWANGVVTVPHTNYYYYRRPNSTVSTKFSQECKEFSRKKVIDFLREQKANIRDREFWAVTKEQKILGMTFLKTKESLHSQMHCLFGILPYRIRSI